MNAMESDQTFLTFIDWLSQRLVSVNVNLDIPRSPRNSELINKKVQGVEEVLKLYSWKTAWTSSSNRYYSQDWESTKISINFLSKNIKSVCESSRSEEDEVLEACRHILEWGGERDNRKGASKFLNDLAANKNLKEYLLASKSAFILSAKNAPLRGQIMQMNSMLTKVHSFLADDGLPIYDSRVAATAACFVEIFRRETDTNLVIPQQMYFPAVGGQGERRSVQRLFNDCSNSRVLRYGQKDIAYEWSRAKWNLGRVIFGVLEKNPNILANEGNLASRAHALEASFFMIGYDVKCLAQ
jgi:hypothetical protein